MPSRLIAAAALGAVLAGPALAQQSPPGQQQRGQQQPAAQQQGATRQPSVVNRTKQDPNVIVLIPLDLEQRIPAEQRARPVQAEELYRGFRASRLMGRDVYGPNGNQIGEVQEIFVDAEGRATAIVVEAGGFLDIGDAALRVPWREVNLTPGREGVQIPITESTAERYDLFDGPETAIAGPREFRLSELIGDYVRLRNGVGYGRVSDVALSREGQILGVLVNRDIGWGAGIYGYPFYGYGYGFDPGADTYTLPLGTAEEAARAPRLDLSRFEAGIL